MTLSISDILFPEHKYSKTILFLVKNKVRFSDDIFKTIAEQNPDIEGEMYLRVLKKLLTEKVISLWGVDGRLEVHKKEGYWFYWNPKVPTYTYDDFIPSVVEDEDEDEDQEYDEPPHNILFSEDLEEFLDQYNVFLTIEKKINCDLTESLKNDILIDLNTKFKPEFICDRKKDRINSIPKFFYDKLLVEDRTCTICLNVIDYDKCDLLLCNHMFHNVCIEKTLELNHICPVCRVDIPEFETQSA